MREPGGSIRTAATLAAIAATGLCLAAQQPDPGQRPAFRSGVELVTVDVNVIDRDGRPVRDLSPSDFTVTVDGQPRRVVSAEFVDVAAAKSQSAGRPDTVPISTNEGVGLGRQFVFIVDQSTLDTGRARQVARAASGFLSQLTFADRSALILLPVGTNVSFTWSHDRVREALQLVAGVSTSTAGWEYGSLTDARDIANQNTAALRTVGQRACGNASAFGGGTGTGSGTGQPPGGGTAPPGTAPPPGGGTGSPTGGMGGAAGMDACMRQLRMQAESTWRMAHMTSLSSLASLHEALNSIGRVRGDKTVFLISGGYPLDTHDELARLAPLASAAAAARATLFPIYVSASSYSVTQRWVSPAPAADRSLHTGPLQTLAAMTGGELLRAEAGADGIFARLGREMSGYYRVGVEKATDDRDVKPRRLRVAVSRAGSTVRAREIFDTRTYEDRDWAARLASALDAPIPADGIPLRVTSYVALHPDDRSRLNMVLTGAATRMQPGETTVQIVVRDMEGRKLLSGEQPVSDSTDEGLQFSMTVPVPPGTYVVRVGVMDSAGQVGSVDHRVEARPVRFGTIAATGPLLARMPARTGGEPRLALGGARQDERLALEIGLDGGSQAMTDADVVFDIAGTVDGPALVHAPAALSRGAYEGAWYAQAVADMRVLPPGEYVVRARIRAGDETVGELRRWFAISAASVPATMAAGGEPAMAGAPPPAPISARAIGAVRPFAPEHVLAPQVLGGFLDGLAARPDAASPGVRDLIAQARTEGVARLSVSAGLAAESPVAAFLRGLTYFSAGQFNAAATVFRDVLRASPDLFPAMVYLGACYAASGRDREAAGAWQTALIREGETVAVHALLADALLREGSGARALQAVERARAKWPGDDAFARRFVVAALLGGKRAEGLRALDALLEQGVDVDEPTLALALLVLYESFEGREPIEGADAARARMARLADRYRARGGPSLALVEAWVAAVEVK
jgi:VWFA-related protein